MKVKEDLNFYLFSDSFLLQVCCYKFIINLLFNFYLRNNSLASYFVMSHN